MLKGLGIPEGALASALALGMEIPHGPAPFGPWVCGLTVHARSVQSP